MGVEFSTVELVCIFVTATRPQAANCLKALGRVGAVRFGDL